jgi:hypothetical protein
MGACEAKDGHDGVGTKIDGFALEKAPGAAQSARTLLNSRHCRVSQDSRRQSCTGRVLPDQVFGKAQTRRQGPKGLPINVALAPS